MLSNCGAGGDSWESLGRQGDQSSQPKRKSTLNIRWKDWCWSWSSNTLATWCKEPNHSKRPWCCERTQVEKRVTEDEMVGWHHWLNGREFEQALGDSEEQGNLSCCCLWGHKESDMTATEPQQIFCWVRVPPLLTHIINWCSIYQSITSTMRMI